MVIISLDPNCSSPMALSVHVVRPGSDHQCRNLQTKPKIFPLLRILLRRLFTIEPKLTYTKISITLLLVIIVIDQWNQTARLYEIPITVIYSPAILVAVASKCCVKRVICKTWTDIGKQCRPRSDAAERLKETVFSPRSGQFSQPSLSNISAVSALIPIVSINCTRLP